jgi:hypothetical protein
MGGSAELGNLGIGYTRYLSFLLQKNLFASFICPPALMIPVHLPRYIIQRHLEFVRLRGH